MATLREWAAFFSGEYSGWFRHPPGDWEDMIGAVTLACGEGREGTLNVAIRGIEVSGWTGSLRVEGLVLSIAGGGEPFELKFRAGDENRGGTFAGRVGSSPPMDLSLTMRERRELPR